MLSNGDLLIGRLKTSLHEDQNRKNSSELANEEETKKISKASVTENSKENAVMLIENQEKMLLECEVSRNMSESVCQEDSLLDDTYKSCRYGDAVDLRKEQNVKSTIHAKRQKHHTCTTPKLTTEG